MTEKKSYREFAKEFKLDALELLKRGEKSAVEIERDLGISPGLLVKWRNRYQVVEKEGQKPQITPSDLDAAKAEIRRLQKELANAEEEREILKKVVNIFSRKNG
jgi:transposase